MCCHITAPLPPPGWDRWNNVGVPRQMPPGIAYPPIPPNVFHHIPPPVDLWTPNAQPRPQPHVCPIHCVGGPVILRAQESGPTQGGNLPNTLNANVRADFPPQPVVSSLPHGSGAPVVPIVPVAPVAQMHPPGAELPHGPGVPVAPVTQMPPPGADEPNVAEQNNETSIQDHEQEENNHEIGSNNDDDDESESSSIVYYMSDSSSDTSGTVDNEENHDPMDVTGNDGVINLQAATEHNGNHEAAASGVDVPNTLRIDGSGDFHLGPQWQVPGTNTARVNAGPEFGHTSTWTEGHGSGGGVNNSRALGENNMVTPTEPNVNTGTRNVLPALMTTLRPADLNRDRELSPGRRYGTTGGGPANYQFVREYRPPTPYPTVLQYRPNYCSTGTQADFNNVIHQDPPVPTDLSMSGAYQPRRSN
ncbi:hypothetical protein F5Y12DRAFT_711326 [Xylaria sp. FL1777]|nr:hypothetical protein F5Y12DRAFT_711326 [Xylaria sp. FL1777]